MKRERSALLLFNRVKVPLPNDRWILVGQPLETFQDTEPNSWHRLFPSDKINMWMWGPSLYSVSSFFSKGWQIVRLLRLYQRESVCGSFTFSHQSLLGSHLFLSLRVDDANKGVLCSGSFCPYFMDLINYCRPSKERWNAAIKGWKYCEQIFIGIPSFKSQLVVGQFIAFRGYPFIINSSITTN